MSMFFFWGQLYSYIYYIISRHVSEHIWQLAISKINSRGERFRKIKRNWFGLNLIWIGRWSWQDVDMVQFTTARLRDFGKDWAVSHIWHWHDLTWPITCYHLSSGSSGLSAHSVPGGPNAPIAIDGGVAGPEPTDPDHQSHDRVPQRLPGVGTHVCTYAYVHDVCVSHTYIYIYNTHTNTHTCILRA